MFARAPRSVLTALQLRWWLFETEHSGSRRRCAVLSILGRSRVVLAGAVAVKKPQVVPTGPLLNDIVLFVCQEVTKVVSVLH